MLHRPLELKVAILADRVGPDALRRSESNQVNAAQAEAVLFAVMTAIEAGNPLNDLPERIIKLKSDEDFLKATGRATADKDQVSLRLDRARVILTSR